MLTNAKTLPTDINELRRLLKTSNGKMFTVIFIKKDGTIRTLNGRLGVTKFLRGGKDTTAHLDEYMNVFDVHQKGYRKINLTTITDLKINKQTYTKGLIW